VLRCSRSRGVRVSVARSKYPRCLTHALKPPAFCPPSQIWALTPPWWTTEDGVFTCSAGLLDPPRPKPACSSLPPPFPWTRVHGFFLLRALDGCKPLGVLLRLFFVFFCFSFFSQTTRTFPPFHDPFSLLLVEEHCPFMIDFKLLSPQKRNSSIDSQ